MLYLLSTQLQSRAHLLWLFPGILPEQGEEMKKTRWLLLAFSLAGCANRDPSLSGVMTVREAGAIIALDKEFREKQ